MNIVDKQLALANLKIQSMTSLEIAELTGKRHDNVLRDIRNVINEIETHNAKCLINNDSSVLSSQIKSSTYKDGSGIAREMFILGKADTLLITTGYSVIQRKIILDRWQFLEDQLQNLKFYKNDKRKQLDAMAALQHLLPNDIKRENLPYIKANTVVDKAVSNLFGFPKMIKKPDMSDDMLITREKVMDDYLNLFEVFDDNSKVKELLYTKWQPKRLTAQ